MITSQILKPVDFTQTQKSRYLESETLFFLQIKKLHIKGYFLAKNSFVAEVTFKYCSNPLSLLKILQLNDFLKELQPRTISIIFQ